MKKTLTTLLALFLLVALAASALASESGLVFTRRNFYGGQTLPVYRGPGHEYGRGANGYAKAYTDEPLYAAGKENGWALVMYETGGGSVRVGWVDLSQFHYSLSRLNLSSLDFSYTRATLNKDCMLTDDPMLNNRDIASLSKGQSVTYLDSLYMHGYWAYIETWAEGRPIRGFVPLDYVSM